MYRKALFTTLLGTALLTNGVEAGRGNGSPNDPRIDATKVDSQQTLLTIQQQLPAGERIRFLRDGEIARRHRLDHTGDARRVQPRQQDRALHLR